MQYFIQTDQEGYIIGLADCCIAIEWPEPIDFPEDFNTDAMWCYKLIETGLWFDEEKYQNLRFRNTRMIKREEAGKACSQAIYEGITLNNAQYSLTEHDQTEILKQLSAVRGGETAVPYHANGQLYRLFPASEFVELADAAMAHISHHRTYCNHLFAWIERETDIAVLSAIVYGCDLPEDLAQSMQEMLGEAGEEESI